MSHNSEYIRPIGNVDPAQWGAIYDLPPVRRLAWRVELPRILSVRPTAVRLELVIVERINKSGGYVICHHADLHIAQFGTNELVSFEQVHSELPTAIRHAVALMQEIRADLQQFEAGKTATELQP